MSSDCSVAFETAMVRNFCFATSSTIHLYYHQTDKDCQNAQRFLLQHTDTKKFRTCKFPLMIENASKKAKKFIIYE
jgi:hypothetical protein